MKYTNKASAHVRKVSGELNAIVPDTIHILGEEETVPKGISASHCVYVVEKASAKDVVNLVNSSGVGHVVQANSAHLVQELLAASVMILKPSEFLADPSKYILSSPTDKESKILVHENKRSWEFDSLGEREKIKQEVEEYLKLVKQSHFVSRSVLSITDELLTNALYHNLPPELQRPNFQNVKFSDDKRASIFISHYKDRVLVGCKDPYGSLDADKLVKRIWATYRSEQIQSLNLSDVGAGIGCRMIFSFCTSLYVNVVKGKGAVVAAILPLGVPNNLSLEHSKNLHATIGGI